MQQVACTFEEYDAMEELFQTMYSNADEYVPTEEELEQEILPNLKEYMLFLLWIDLTGIKTEENKDMRSRIHKVIQERLILVEDLSEISSHKKGEEKS